MDHDIETLAVFARAGGYVQAGLAQMLAHPPAEVWTFLTDPERLAQWLAPGSIELVEGGRVRLDFPESGVVIDSVVRALSSGRLLEYSWSAPGEPERPLCWSLEAVGSGCRLSLTLSVPEHEDAARAAAGWAAHLEMLAAALEGVPTRFPFERFKAMRETYGRRVAAGADRAALQR